MIKSIVLHRDALNIGVRAPAACLMNHIEIAPSNAVFEKSVSICLKEFSCSENAKTAFLNANGQMEIFKALGYTDQSPAGERLRTSFLNHGFKRINNVVDAYNLISAKYGIGLGMHDAMKLNEIEKIHIYLATGNEIIRPLFKRKEFKIPKGDLIYGGEVGSGVSIAWLGKMDVDCDDFKVTSETGSVLLVVLGNANTDYDLNVKICLEVHELIKQNCPDAQLQMLPTFVEG